MSQAWQEKWRETIQKKIRKRNPTAYEVGPFWTFLYGLHSYAASEFSVDWMRLDFVAREFQGLVDQKRKNQTLALTLKLPALAPKNGEYDPGNCEKNIFLDNSGSDARLFVEVLRNTKQKRRLNRDWRMLKRQKES